MPLSVACKASDADKHTADVTSLLWNNGKLYSASDDGTVKLWSDNLVKQAEVKAHSCSVYSIAASNDTLYTCSNEGKVNMFDLESLKSKGTLTELQGGEFYKVLFNNGHLFVGDNEGNVKVYKNNNVYEGAVDLAENIKDMVVVGNILITAKDNDVIVAEMKIEDGAKVQYGYKAEFTGRAPVTLIGDKLFAYVTREGKEICLHENNNADKYKQIARITNASELIINALAGTVSNGQEQLYSAGWDKSVHKWAIKNNAPSDDGSVNVEIVVNALAVGNGSSLYAAGSDGHIVRIDQS